MLDGQIDEWMDGLSGTGLINGGWIDVGWINGWING